MVEPDATALPPKVAPEEQPPAAAATQQEPPAAAEGEEDHKRKLEAGTEANGAGEDAKRPRVEGDGAGVSQNNESSEKVEEPAAASTEGAVDAENGKVAPPIEDLQTGSEDKPAEPAMEAEAEAPQQEGGTPGVPQETSRKIDVPNDKVGVLIGKAGETIRNLQMNSGTKIQITKDEDADADANAPTRSVELVGTLESIDKAEQLIKNVIAEAEAGGSPALIARGIDTKLTLIAYVEILEECDLGIPAWFAFTSKDGTNVVSGDSLMECASVADSCKEVATVGINCTPPRFIHALVLSVRKDRAAYMFLLFPSTLLLLRWWIWDGCLPALAVQVYQAWLLFLYTSFAMRENVLIVNGSDTRPWWIYHHYLAMLMALVSLTWEIKGQADCSSKQRGVQLFLRWAIMQGIAMHLQNRYQRQRLRTRIALGKAKRMDVVAGETAGVEGQLLLLYPVLFILQVCGMCAQSMRRES